MSSLSEIEDILDTEEEFWYDSDASKTADRIGKNKTTISILTMVTVIILPMTISILARHHILQLLWVM